MARPHEAEDSEEEEASEHAKVKPRIVKKRKEVTTASILESFLLLATSLDDTVRQDAVARALGEAPESSSSTKGAQGSSKNENKTSEVQTRLVNHLNRQRQDLREDIREAITNFALDYDTESVRLGEENDSEFDYDPDEQVNLPKERWSIDKAIEKLKQLNDEMKMGCVDLGRNVRQQEKSLSRLVDDIAEQRKQKQK